MFGESLLIYKFSLIHNVSNENNLKNNLNNDKVTVLNFQHNVCLSQQQKKKKFLTKESIQQKRQREQSLPFLQKKIITKFENIKHLNFCRQGAFTINGLLNNANLSDKENFNHNVSLKNQKQHESIVRFADFVNKRTSSMMSHKTFVLENSQHKPLLISSGFTKGKKSLLIKKINYIKYFY